MRAFVDLYIALDATNSSAEKTALLEGYLSSAGDADAACCVGLIAGQRPKGGTSSKKLTELALERSGVPGWLLSECRAAVGELSETLALIVPGDGGGVDGGLSLAETMERYVLPLSGLDEAGKAAVIGEAWDRFDRDERFVYHKLVRGGFRVGVGTGLLSKAVAAVGGIERELVQHRLAATFEPTAEGWRALISAGVGARVGPYPFYLAHQLDRAVSELGDVGGWIVEWKWDGIRAQLVKRGSEATLWSRSGEAIGHQFPEIVSAAGALGDGVVLDGEVLLVSKESSNGGMLRPLPFSALQKRLNRKVAPTVQMGLFETERVVFLAFDVLEVGGEDVRGVAMAERRVMLEGVVDGSGTIVASPVVGAGSWEELAALRGESRARGVEGLMLKGRESVYGVGRTKTAEGAGEGGGDAVGGWWKWKVDPYAIDCVLTTAYPGSGRRASLYTDYGFSVVDEDGGLVAVTRAYSGLTNEEIEELDSWIRRHTTERHGPVRSVEATRVFEIGFEGIARSGRHKAGVALRFPRILRERKDKAASEATRLVEVLGLLAPDDRGVERGGG